MRRKFLQTLLDAPSVWCIRLLCLLSLAATCALAYAHSQRTVWLVITSVLLLLLGAVNRLRIHNRVKRLAGSGKRPKRTQHVGHAEH